MQKIKAVLAIAGSDPSGGAGIQADLKTFAAMQVFGCAAITCLTVQNTKGVASCHPVDPDLVNRQTGTEGDTIEFAPEAEPEIVDGPDPDIRVGLPGREGRQPEVGPIVRGIRGAETIPGRSAGGRRRQLPGGIPQLDLGRPGDGHQIATEGIRIAKREQVRLVAAEQEWIREPVVTDPDDGDLIAVHQADPVG